MPKITIYEQDLTGALYMGDETVVYVPGHLAFKDDTLPDGNDCYLLLPNATISEVLVAPAEAPATNKDKQLVAYIQKLLDSGLYVLYNYIESYTAASTPTVDYLKDKNMYNIKYMTCGIEPSVSITSEGGEYSAGFGFGATLLAIAGLRQDCIVLFDLDSTADNLKAADIKEALTGVTLEDEEYAACFYPNVSFGGYVMPASFAYLVAAAKAIKFNKKWDSVAGVNRGILDSSMKPARVMSKYDIDTEVMDVLTGGRCFNGIVNINAFGDTIWGDRTLLNNTAGIHGVKGSSFLSIRSMLCDIKKRIYAAAIQNTYETNNDVTWMNFKNQIVSLLNMMAADGKLESFKITKLPSDYMSQIKCKIKLVPNMPVEDFEINITLENAQVETTEA